MNNGNVDTGLLVVIVLLGLLVLGSLYLLPKLWRSEADIQKREATAKWWPFSEAFRAGFVRSIPAAVVACVMLELGLIAGFFEKYLTDDGSRFAGRLTVYFGTAFVVMLLVDLSVTLFNRPKFIVPPDARDEPGAVPLWWSSRKYKRTSRRRAN
jgi:fumarate reductase subunit C